MCEARKFPIERYIDRHQWMECEVSSKRGFSDWRSSVNATKWRRWEIDRAEYTVRQQLYSNKRIFLNCWKYIFCVKLPKLDKVNYGVQISPILSMLPYWYYYICAGLYHIAKDRSVSTVRKCTPDTLRISRVPKSQCIKTVPEDFLRLQSCSSRAGI